MSERFQAEAVTGLFDFLTARLPDWNRNTLRRRLRAGCVLVNGEPMTRGDHELAAGDKVEIRAADQGVALRTSVRGMNILFEDTYLIAIDKPAGLLSVGTARQRERTALDQLRSALGRDARLWPVHRLDRGTSGVLLFARSREACDQTRAHWDSASKTYLAVVDGHPEPADGCIEEPLWEDRDLRVHVGEHPRARAAETHYRTLHTARSGALLEVELRTGRRHQIRAHLAWLGHPVSGDERFGRGGARMMLHAARLEVRHPVHDRRISIEAPPPSPFRPLLERAR